MDHVQFYKQLFAPLADQLGPLDRDTLVAIIGFDAGGPLNFCTIRRGRTSFVSYVSCELAVREEQRPASFGRYELLATCDDEGWVRSILSEIGRMSLEVTFDAGHTLDIGPCVDESAPIQGVVFEKLYSTRIDDVAYGVLVTIGVTRDELDYAREHGVESLLGLLKNRDLYPKTSIARSSIL